MATVSVCSLHLGDTHRQGDNNAFLTFGQKYYGERLRIYIARDLAQTVIDRILSYRMAFSHPAANKAGKLPDRIERGIESLTRLIQHFFYNILPLFANSIVALVMMFNANFYVGLVGLCIVPVSFYLSWLQAQKLRGARGATSGTARRTRARAYSRYSTL